MPGYEYVKSVLHALDSLEIAASSPDGVPLFDIANGLNLSKPAAYNVVRTLVHRGYLEKVCSPTRYRLGPVMLTLRQRQAHWNRAMLARATPIAIRLARRFAATVRVCQYIGGDIVSRLDVPGESAGPPQFLYSRKIAPYGTALLEQAFMEPTELADYRKRYPLEGNSLVFWKSNGNVDRFLEMVRSEGHLAFLRDTIFRTAAPVFEPSGTMISAISLVKTMQHPWQLDIGKCISAVRHAAEQLSSSLEQGHMKALLTERNLTH